MTGREFSELADDLGLHLIEAVSEFFRTRGIEPDWFTYWEHTTMDQRTAQREILYYCANLWPDTEQTTMAQAA